MLKLSTKGRYAARILVCLATKDNGMPTQRREIAKEEAISMDYVEQILIRLRTANLVRSCRGVKGGYFLARDAATITIEDAIEASEGKPSVGPDCKNECKRNSACVVQSVWQKANKALVDLFSSITIAELAQEAKKLKESKSSSFSI